MVNHNGLSQWLIAMADADYSKMVEGTMVGFVKVKVTMVECTTVGITMVGVTMVEVATVEESRQ